MEALSLMQNLTVVLGAAVVTLLLFKKLGQPPVLGYLAAGFLVGPHIAPGGLQVDPHAIEALAEIGIVFLLFALGVEFNLRRLATLGLRPVFAAFIEVAIMLAVGWKLGQWAGWRPVESVLLGAVVALASTAIVARTVMEAGRHHAEWGDLVSGVLIAEDLVAVILIAGFSSLGQFGSWELATGTWLLWKFMIITCIVLVPGLYFLPKLLRLVEGPGMVEVRTLLIVGTCFGVALLTERLGFSAGLGAFLAGAMAAESGSSRRLHEATAPFKDVFGAVFFVAVGMLIDPSWIAGHWKLVLSWAAVVVVARFVANAAALTAIGEEVPATVQMTLARLPIGEFSFVLAQVGARVGLTEEPLYPLAVTISVITTLSSALLLPRTFHDPERLNAWVPGPLARMLAEYRFLLKRLAVPRRFEMAWTLVKPSVVQILLNVLGISGLFLGAQWVDAAWRLSERFPGSAWTAVAFVSLPFLLALWRKLQAVMLILIEVVATKSADDAPPLEKYKLLTRAILGVTTVVVALWYLTLSVRLLPPWPWTLVPPLVIFSAGVMLWRGMNKLYANIQINLRETLSSSQAEPEAAPSALSYLIESDAPERVNVEALRLDKGAWCAGKTLRDTRVRRQTGAIVLQINRAGRALPSPDPDTVLEDKDELLIFGLPDQLRRAKAFLKSGPKDAA